MIAYLHATGARGETLPMTQQSAHFCRPTFFCRIHLCQTSNGSAGVRCVGDAKLARCHCHSPCALPALPCWPPARLTAFACQFRSVATRRDFVLSSYAELKKANPNLPILIRECSGIEAKLVARYGGCCCCSAALLPEVLCVCSMLLCLSE